MIDWFAPLLLKGNTHYTTVIGISVKLMDYVKKYRVVFASYPCGGLEAYFIELRILLTDQSVSREEIAFENNLHPKI